MPRTLAIEVSEAAEEEGLAVAIWVAIRLLRVVSLTELLILDATAAATVVAE